MPLPNYYLTASPADLSHRLTSSLIEFDGVPVMVVAVGAHSIKFVRPLCLDMMTEDKADPRFNVSGLGSKLGFFKGNQPNTIFRPMRCVYKGTTQGLTYANLALLQRQNSGGFTDIFGSMYNHHLPGVAQGVLNTEDLPDDEKKILNKFSDATGARWDLPFLLLQKDFVDIWSSGYRNPPSITQFVENKRPGDVDVVSADILFIKDDFNQAYVAFRGLNVGLIQQDRIKYIPSKAYLAGEIERQTGLMPI